MSLKRKLLAGIIPLAALCLFAPVTEAKAETVTNDNTYKVEGDYEVSIPATVTVDSSTNSGKLNINGTLNACHNLEITITSENQYQLVNESNKDRKISYKISDDKVVFSNRAGSDTESLDYNIDVNVTETPVVSGTYTDLLKFLLNQNDYSLKPKKHQLIFNGNASGDNEVLISTGYKYVTESAQYGMLPTPKRKGYTFLGWFSGASDGTEIKETDVMENQDTTVYAHWKANVLTLHYHSGGAQERQYYGDPENEFTQLKGEDVVETETIAYDKQYQHYKWGLLNVSRLRKKGYHPNGANGADENWRVGSPESKHLVSATTEIADPYTGKKVAEYLSVLEELEAGDTTVELYPVFYPNEYTVKYEANADDATGTTESTTHTYDVASELAKNGFTREGYTFECWVKVNSKDNSEDSKEIFSEGAMVSNLTDKNNVTITLYARWKKITASDDSANDTKVQTIQNTPDTLNQGSSISEERTTSDDASHENTSTESEEILESEQSTIKSEESPEPETLESGSVESIEPEQSVTESVTQETIASE